MLSKKEYIFYNNLYDYSKSLLGDFSKNLKGLAVYEKNKIFFVELLYGDLLERRNSFKILSSWNSDSNIVEVVNKDECVQKSINVLALESSLSKLLQNILKVCTYDISYPISKLVFSEEQCVSKKVENNGEYSIFISCCNEKRGNLENLLNSEVSDYKVALEELVGNLDLRDDRDIHRKGFRKEIETLVGKKVSKVSISEVKDNEIVTLAISSGIGYTESGSSYNYYMGYRTRVKRLGFYKEDTENIEVIVDGVARVRSGGYFNNSEKLLVPISKGFVGFTRDRDLYEAYKSVLIENSDKFGLYL